MDIEKVQKVNQLARELLQHRMAKDMEEATALAENMIESKAEVTDLKSRVQQDEAKKSGETSPAQAGPAQAADQRDLRKLSQYVQEVAAVVADLNSRMSTVTRRLDHIESELDRIKQRSQAVVLEKEKGAEQTTLRPQEKRSSSEPHPKVGNFNPQDVAIDRIFYSGPKD